MSLAVQSGLQFPEASVLCTLTLFASVHACKIKPSLVIEKYKLLHYKRFVNKLAPDGTRALFASCPSPRWLAISWEKTLTETGRELLTGCPPSLPSGL